MPRPKEPPKTRKFIWVPDEMLLEIQLLYPNMRDAHGFAKYGAFNNYVVNLIRHDLEKKTEELKEASNG